MFKIKLFLVSLALLSLFVSFSCCNKNSKKTKEGAEAVLTTDSTHFGAMITKDGAKDIQELATLFTTDTVKIKVFGIAKEVCQHSGCWLTLAYKDGEILVNMKNHEFSVPKDLVGKTVWAEGLAVRELIDVNTQRKMANENGRPQAEIDAIIDPIYDYSIEADGVIVK